MGCVYVLVGPTSKLYVGKTVNKNLHTYLKRCVYEAMKGRDSKPKLYRAFRKHGAQNFTAHKLFESDNNDLLCGWEKYYIKDFMTVEYGYNIAEGGEGAGYKHGPDCRHCLWARTKGAQILRANPRKNYVMSDITKQRLREANKGQEVSESRRKAVSMFHKGRKRSEQTKEKMRESAKDRKRPPAFTEEHRKHKSEGAKRDWARRKALHLTIGNYHDCKL